MGEHRVAVFVGDHRIRVAKCSCGWEGLPHLLGYVASLEGERHYAEASRPAPERPGEGGES